MNKFVEQLRPTYVAANVEALTPDLFLMGEMLGDVEGVAFDVDGTFVNYHETKLDPRTERNIKTLTAVGLKLYIISNAYDARVGELEDMFGEHALGMQIITPGHVAGGGNPKRHRKPRPDMLLSAAEDANGSVLMVGDQMSKDVLSANLAGMPSLLVPRRGEGDHWGVKKFQRPAEAVLRKYMGLPVAAADFPPEVTPAA